MENKMVQNNKNDVILSVEHLKTYFYQKRNQEPIRAVDDVSFQIIRGSITAIVGQSGSGKSVTSMSIFNLVDSPGKIVGGSIVLNGKNLLKLSNRERNKIYGKEVTMIFQEPASALNPVVKVKKQMLEMIFLHQKMNRNVALEKCREALKRVNLKDTNTILEKYPFELSGGMCQRIMIAMAIVSNADLLIADEPTTALDLTVQAVVLNEIKKLRDAGMSIMLITHDLGIVAQMADYVYVMNDGKIVESGNVFDIFDHPQHEYTKTLLGAAEEKQEVMV
jgi:hypothetical protein